MTKQQIQQHQTNTKSKDKLHEHELVNEKMKMKQANERLMKENDQYKEQIAKLNMDYSVLHDENQKMKAIRKENEKLMKEHKELQTKYDKLIEKQSEMALKQNKNDNDLPSHLPSVVFLACVGIILLF